MVTLEACAKSVDSFRREGDTDVNNVTFGVKLEVITKLNAREDEFLTTAVERPPELVLSMVEGKGSRGLAVKSNVDTTRDIVMETAECPSEVVVTGNAKLDSFKLSERFWDA